MFMATFMIFFVLFFSLMKPKMPSTPGWGDGANEISILLTWPKERSKGGLGKRRRLTQEDAKGILVSDDERLRQCEEDNEKKQTVADG